MAEAPQIELMICTRNRAAQLRECLASCAALRPGRPWALIVVDNGSADETPEVVARFAGSAPFEVRYVLERRPGLANAHNAGLRVTRAEILAFTDDDCYPRPDYLDRVWECFAEDGRLGFLGGRIFLHDPADVPVTIQLRETRVDLPPGGFLPAGLIQGANFSCRRSALLAAGGFDPWFGPGGHFNAEEIDMMARLSAAGWRGAYDPRPAVSHHHGRKREHLPALLRSYDRGRGGYYAKSLLNPRLTRAYARAWLWSLRRERRRVSLREIGAGAEYWWRALWDRGRRFAPIEAEAVSRTPAPSA